MPESGTPVEVLLEVGPVVEADAVLDAELLVELDGLSLHEASLRVAASPLVRSARASRWLSRPAS
jgi:hypothetical protein